MMPYGFPRKHVENAFPWHKRSVRAKQKRFCQNVISETPPILANGLLEVCHENHGGDISGCVEDECALIPNSEEF